MDSAFLPAPYQGVNELLPIAAVKNPYCENLLNFNTTAAGISLRYGDSVYHKFTRAGGGDIMGLFPYGESTKLFVAIRDRFAGTIDFIDADDGSVDYTTINALATTALTYVFFNNYLFIYGNTSTLATGITFNGTAWGTSGYTGTNLWPIGGNVFKRRQYLVQLNESAYWYTPIDAISGACTKVDLTTIVENSTTLSSIGSFTLSQPTSTELYQAFIMANGEVLFYSGSYPDGSDWTIVGRAKVSQPLAPSSVIPYQGDTLILTDAGVVSLRDLFLSGSQQASSLTLSDVTQSTWNALVQAIRTSLSNPVGPITAGYLVGSIRGVFDTKNNRIVISFPYYINSSGTLTTGSFYFIFNNELQSWYFHQSFGGRIYDITRYKNTIKMITTPSNSNGTFVVYDKEGRDSFTDRNSADDANTAYDYEMLSAPVPYKKDAVYTISGIEAILESDLYAETSYRLIADFGRQETSAQVVDALTTSIQKPMINIGITANFAQVKMYGTTAASKSVGLDLYGYNVWFDKGEVGSR